MAVIIGFSQINNLKSQDFFNWFNKNKELIKENDSLKLKLEKFKGVNDILEKRNKELTSDYENCIDTRYDLNRRLDIIVTDSLRKTYQISTFRRTIEVKDSVITRKNDSIKLLIEENLSLNTKIEQKDQEIAKLNTEKTLLNDSIDTLNRIIAKIISVTRDSSIVVTGKFKNGNEVILNKSCIVKVNKIKSMKIRFINLKDLIRYDITMNSYYRQNTDNEWESVAKLSGIKLEYTNIKNYKEIVIPKKTLRYGIYNLIFSHLGNEIFNYSIKLKNN